MYYLLGSYFGNHRWSHPRKQCYSSLWQVYSPSLFFSLISSFWLWDLMLLCCCCSCPLEVLWKSSLWFFSDWICKSSASLFFPLNYMFWTKHGNTKFVMLNVVCSLSSGPSWAVGWFSTTEIDTNLGNWYRPRVGLLPYFPAVSYKLCNYLSSKLSYVIISSSFFVKAEEAVIASFKISLGALNIHLASNTYCLMHKTSSFIFLFYNIVVSCMKTMSD